MKSNEQIIKEIDEYCETYNIPLEHVVDVISSAKVIPMIRGKAFEYTVSDLLKNILPENTWEVTNPKINAQSEIHDIDVNIIRKRDKKRINIECKLAGKDSFVIRNGIATFKVKCMRSRTVSDNEMATRMARKYGVSRGLVLSHADNYRKDDFDFVITTLSNAFWTTEDNKYVFDGKESDHVALSKLFPNDFKRFEEFRKEAFNFILVSESSKIVVSRSNDIMCSRKKCIKKGFAKKCGFIPNYPIVNLNDVSNGIGPWKPISSVSDIFDNF